MESPGTGGTGRAVRSSSLGNCPDDDDEATFWLGFEVAFVLLESERVLVDETIVLSLFVERRLLKGLRAWKEAMELKRRSELR